MLETSEQLVCPDILYELANEHLYIDAQPHVLKMIEG